MRSYLCIHTTSTSVDVNPDQIILWMEDSLCHIIVMLE